jgi:hypothetical protein
MPFWAKSNGAWLQVAPIGIEHDDERYVEWLEGPNHEHRSYVRTENLVQQETRPDA